MKTAIELNSLKQQLNDAMYDVIEIEGEADTELLETLPGFCSAFGLEPDNSGYFIISDNFDATCEALDEQGTSYTITEVFQPSMLDSGIRDLLNAPAGTKMALSGDAIWIMDRDEVAEMIGNAIAEFLKN